MDYISQIMAICNSATLGTGCDIFLFVNWKRLNLRILFILKAIQSVDVDYFSGHFHL